MSRAGLCWPWDELAPRQALARAWGLRARLDGAVQVGLSVAQLAEPARILGRYVPAGASDELRRASGGPTVVAPAGTLHLALALREAGVLIDTPPDKLLNRNLRPTLRGLGAQYYGREFISLLREVVGIVGWSRDAQGRVLIEVFVGVEAPVEIAPMLADHQPLRGKTPSSMRAQGRGETARLLGERLLAAHARFGPGVEFAKVDDEPTLGPNLGLEASPPRVAEVDWGPSQHGAIGALQLGRRDDADVLELRGEVFADEGLGAWLSEQLRAGHAPAEVAEVAERAVADGRIEGVTAEVLAAALVGMER